MIPVKCGENIVLMPGVKHMPASEKIGPIRLATLLVLPAEDSHQLARVVTRKLRIGARTDIVREGDPCHAPFIVLEGAACVFRITPEGRRQIFSFLLPGSLYGFDEGFLERADHSISSICPTTLEFIPRANLYELVRQSPRIDTALRRISLRDEARLREHIMALGRNAHSRVAWLLCDLVARFDAAGIKAGPDFCLPLSQIDIADALALTPVHVNRILRKLREDRLVAEEPRKIRVLDTVGLSKIAGLNSASPQCLS